MKAIHAPITDVKYLATRQVVALRLEIPCEYFAAVAQFLNAHVLVTLAPESLKDAPFGVIDSTPGIYETKIPAEAMQGDRIDWSKVPNA